MASEHVHIPEVIEPDEKLPRDLVALRRFAHLMDEAFEIPGTRMRVGLDAIIGLIPGIGDVIGAVMSAWIIVGGVRHRVPVSVLARMVVNVAIDLIFGSVPLAGDVFDFLFEENVKNMRLLEKHRNRRQPPRSPGQMAFLAFAVMASIFVMAVLIIAAAIALAVWLLRKVPWV